MKEFKAMEKSRILAMARSQYNMFIAKRQKLENKLSVITTDFDMDSKLEEYRKKLEEQLQKKTEKLRELIELNRKEQAAWTPQGMTELLEGHSIEELVNFSYSTSETGKRSLVAEFKYDTVLPPAVDLNEEMPDEYDSAGFNGSDEELAADMERSAQQDAIYAKHDCEDCEERDMPDLRGTLVEDADGHKELVMTDEDIPAPAAEDIPEVNTIEEAAAIVDNYFAPANEPAPAPSPVEDFAESTEVAFKQAIDELTAAENIKAEADAQLEQEADELEAMLDAPEEEADDDPWAETVDDSDPFDVF